MWAIKMPQKMRVVFVGGWRMCTQSATEKWRWMAAQQIVLRSVRALTICLFNRMASPWRLRMGSQIGSCFPPTRCSKRRARAHALLAEHCRSLCICLAQVRFTLNGLCLLLLETYGWGPWQWWVASAGWSECLGSVHSRCSHSGSLLCARWKSTGPHSRTGTLACSEAAFGSLKWTVIY